MAVTGHAMLQSGRQRFSIAAASLFAGWTVIPGRSYRSGLVLSCPRGRPDWCRCWCNRHGIATKSSVNRSLVRPPRRLVVRKLMIESRVVFVQRSIHCCSACSAITRSTWSIIMMPFKPLWRCCHKLLYNSQLMCIGLLWAEEVFEPAYMMLNLRVLHDTDQYRIFAADKLLKWICRHFLAKCLYYGPSLQNREIILGWGLKIFLGSAGPPSPSIWYCPVLSSSSSYHNTALQLTICSEAKASVPGASNKLGGWVIDWLIEYAVFLHELSQQWRPRKKQNLAQR